MLALVLAVVARCRAGQEGASTRAPRAAPRTVAARCIVALPALLLPFLIRTAVVEGVATATEVSTIGIAYSLVARPCSSIGAASDGARVRPMLVQTASLSGAILFIVGAASAMAWALTQSGFSHDLAAAMAAVPGGTVRFPAGLDRRLHRAGKRARGHPGHRAVRPPSVSDRTADWGS